MAADYARYLYTDDLDQTHSIRLAVTGGDAQAATASSAAATGSPVESRRSSRSQTLQVRGVRLSRTVGTAPNQGLRTTFLPILALDDYQALTKGTTVTIGTTAYTVSRQVPELNTR